MIGGVGLPDTIDQGMTTVPTPETLLRDAPPSALQQLLCAGLIEVSAFAKDDYAGILRHQLDAPVLTITADEPWDQGPMAPDPSLTFRRVLLAKTADRDRLEMIRRYAKHQVQAPDYLPEPVALVLYYAAIAAGLVGLNQKLTSLPTPAVREGLAWAMHEPWVDPAVHHLLKTAQSHCDRF